MTLRELLTVAGEHPLGVAALFLAMPLTAWLLGLGHGPGGGHRSPWKYGYAALVYITCVPGILAVVVVVYSLLFTGENLLDVPVLVYFLPPAAMAATLLVIGRQVPFSKIPGFDRLSGLMILIALSLVIALTLQKMRIWVLFGASLVWLLVLAAVVFLGLRWASRRVLGRT